MNSKLSRACEGILEVGWLFALIATPLFFNIQSDRIFEPDKLTLLRSIVLVMSAAWIVRFIETQGWREWAADPTTGRRAPWQMPLALPVLILAIVYLLSTMFSIVPRISFIGSYQRLQGTVSTLSYILLFGYMVSTIKRREQVDRAITIVIISSLAVALYGVLQHEARDPLPWGGDTQTRVAGHMGNAIFIGAYLVMAIPLTIVRLIHSFRKILVEEILKGTDIVQASVYAFILPVQFVTLFWTQSRGPWLGLAVGFFAMLLIMLVALRNNAPQRFSTRSLIWPAIFPIVGLAALFGATAIYGGGSAQGSFLFFVAIMALLLLVILVLLAVNQTWHWLWLSFLLTTLFVAGWLLSWNVVTQRTVSDGGGQLVQMYDAWGELPGIGRFGQLLESSDGTGRVRLLIWQGALDMLRPGNEALTYPDGRNDPFRLLRPIFGYGPESMYVAYNRYYPPELALWEARNASPDRSHNETFDALVITGAAGFLVWQWLYVSVFYYGFKWLGVVPSKRDRNLLIGFWVGGAVLLGGVLTQLMSPEFLGVALPFGSIIGLVAYLIYHATIGRSDESVDSARAFSWRRLTIIGLLAAVVAHYVEIHFGIAIASTRTHFFAFIALLVIVGRMEEAPELAVSAESDATPTARRKRRARGKSTPARTGWTVPALGSGLLLGLMMMTLTFGFSHFTPQPGELENLTSVNQLPTTVEIIQRAFLVNSRAGFEASPFLYGLILVTWLLGALLLYSELVDRSDFGRNRAATSNPQLIGGLAAATGLIALLWGGISFVGRADLIALMAGAVGAIWGLVGLIAGALLLLGRNQTNARDIIGGFATVGAAFGVAVLFVGGALPGLALLVLCGGLLFLGWNDGWSERYGPLFVIGTTSIICGLFMAFVQASLLRGLFIPPPGITEATPIVERRFIEGVRVTNFLTTYYFMVFAVLFLAGLLMAWRRMGSETQVGHRFGLIAATPLLLLSLFFVYSLNMRLIHADMIYKRARPFDQTATSLTRQGDLPNATSNWDISIALYERAIELVPREDFYYLFLGRAYLEKAGVVQGNEQTSIFATADEVLQQAQSINPLNTDHTANLARLNVRRSRSDINERQLRALDAEEYYDNALVLSPQNSIVRNEKGGLQLTILEDCDAALDTFNESATVDPFYTITYYSLVDAYTTCAQRAEDPAEQVAFYDEAMAALDVALTQPTRGERTRTELTQGVAQRQFSVAQLYQNAGETEAAQRSAEAALAGANPNLVPQIETFLEALP